MAEKNRSVTFDAIMRDLQARHFSPIYILMGEESYYIDRIADFIAENVMPEEERDFNQSIVFGSDVTAVQVADLARGYPMMAQYRVVIVKEAQNIKKTDALEKYFERPVPSTILVYCYKNGTIDRRKKFLSKAQAAGAVVFESKKKRDYELPAFIEDYLRQHQATIDRKSAEMIADHVGADLNRLVSELDKVLVSLPEDNRRITPQIVEEQIGVSKDFNVFEFRDAIINRNVYKANQIMKYFDNNPKSEDLYSLLPRLFGFFQNLMLAYYAPNRRSEEGVARFLELRSAWQARDYVIGMRNFTGNKVMQILLKMREIDAKSKGLDNPNTDKSDLMKELIFFILH